MSLASALDEAPNAIAVPPMVIELFTKPALGKPVALVKTALDGVPSAGVTSVGLVAKTNDPLPVSSVTAAAKLALDGVTSHVAALAFMPDRLLGK